MLNVYMYDSHVSADYPALCSSWINNLIVVLQ